MVILLTTVSSNCSIWWSYLKLNDSILYLYFSINLLLIFYIFINLNNQINNSIEFNLSICSIILILPLIFFSNNLYSFFFILEVSVLYIFFQFINNKLRLKLKNSINNLNSVFIKNYIYLIFFNFWVSFFSSIFLLYAIIYLTSLTGVLDYHLIQFIFSIIDDMNYFNNKFFISISMFLLFNSIFIKLGLTPIQLYKLEIYKSLSLNSILFYTIIYFFIFFLFFYFLFFNYFLNFKNFFIHNLIFLIIFGFIVLAIYLYEVNLLKVFLAYSTIINSLFFLIFITSNNII